MRMPFQLFAWNDKDPFRSALELMRAYTHRSLRNQSPTSPPKGIVCTRAIQWAAISRQTRTLARDTDEFAWQSSLRDPLRCNVPLPLRGDLPGMTIDDGELISRVLVDSIPTRLMNAPVKSACRHKRSNRAKQPTENPRLLSVLYDPCHYRAISRHKQTEEWWQTFVLPSMIQSTLHAYKRAIATYPDHLETRIPPYQRHGIV